MKANPENRNSHPEASNNIIGKGIVTLNPDVKKVLPLLKRNFESRKIVNQDELDQAFSLRYKIFVEVLRWLLPNSEKKEKDQYDLRSAHFGVFNRKTGEIEAYLRAIEGERLEDFMIGNEFMSLLDDPSKLSRFIKKNGVAIEISRLARRNGSQTSSGIVQLLLYKEVNKWAVRNDYWNWYMVVEKKLLVSLRRMGFIIQELSRGTMDGSGICIVAMLDLKATRKNLQKNIKMFEWFFEHECNPTNAVV